MDQDFLRSQLSSFSRVHQVMPIETNLVKGLAWTNGPLLGGGEFKFFVLPNPKMQSNEIGANTFCYAGFARVLAGADGTLGPVELGKATQMISMACYDFYKGTYENKKGQSFVVFDDCLREKMSTLGLLTPGKEFSPADGDVFTHGKDHFMDQLKLAARLRNVNLTDETAQSIAQRFPYLERQRFGRVGLDEIVERIPDDLNAALRSTTRISPEIWRYYAEPGEIGMRRLQAASSFPLLANQLSELNRVKLQNAIKNGEPLAPVIQDRLGLAKPVVKRLPKLIWEPDPVTTDEALKALNSCPPDWIPTNEKDWRAFCEIVGICHRITDMTGIPFMDIVKHGKGKWSDLMSKSIAQLPSVAAGVDENEVTTRAREETRLRIEGNANSRLEAFAGTLNFLTTQVSVLRNSLVMPLISHQARAGLQDAVESSEIRSATKLAGRMVCEGKSLPDIIETARRWSYTGHETAKHVDIHSRRREEIDRHNDEIMEQVQATHKGGEDEQSREWAKARQERNALELEAYNLRWPCFFGGRTFTASNGLIVECLTSTQELIDESEGNRFAAGMDHCVGRWRTEPGEEWDERDGENYNTNCLSGRSAVLGIRKYNGDGTFERMATIEVIFDMNLVSRASNWNNPLGCMHPDGRSYSIRQYQGPRNDGVTDETQQAFEELKRAVSVGTFTTEHMINYRPTIKQWNAISERYVAVNKAARAATAAMRERIAELKEKLLKPEDLAEPPKGVVGQMCRYDWTDERNITDVWKIWADPSEEPGRPRQPAILSGKWRKMGLEALSQSDAIMDVAKAINPFIKQINEVAYTPLIDAPTTQAVEPVSAPEPDMSM